jgi:Ni2+-binding GTPase involved in maturation of urease and hydrogenase
MIKRTLDKKTIKIFGPPGTGKTYPVIKKSKMVY